jgi:hypothetical protein
VNNGRDEKIDALLFTNSDVDGADNSKNEKHESDDGQEIKVNTVITTDITEQVGGNHIGHCRRLYTLRIFFLYIAKMVVGY